VLTEHTLFYYLVPKRGGKSETTSSLLGDERGQLRLNEISSIQREYDADAVCRFVIKCEGAKKANFTQSSNTKYVLRARTNELTEKWFLIIKGATERVRSGGGQRIENILSSGELNEFLDNPASASQQDDVKKLRAYQSSVSQNVLPVIEKCQKLSQQKLPKAVHLDPYWIGAGLIAVNVICYQGFPLNDLFVWFSVNAFVLLGIITNHQHATDLDVLTTKLDKVFHTLKHELDDASVSLQGDFNSKEVEFRPTAVSLASGLIAGSTMQCAAESEKIPESWSPCDGTIFKVRDVGYASHKRKIASKPALYDCIAMDLVSADTKIEGAHTHFQIPAPRECDDLDMIKASGLPRVLIVNFQVPSRGPSPFATGDDPGVSLIQYFGIKPETAKAAGSGDTSRPELNLFKRFVNEWHMDESIRRRFKGIGVAANFEDLPLPNKFSTFNGKPVILYKAALPMTGEEFLEINVMVHKFAFVARTILQQFKNLSANIEIRNAFVIQGEDDDELPECVIACAEIHNMDFSNAKHLDTL